MLYRDSWIEIDLDLFKKNIQQLKGLSNKKFIAVIKANGYGGGDGSIAFSAMDAGADMLAVSSLDEALSLRYEGIGLNIDILVLGYINPQFAPIIKEKNITATVVSLDWAKEFAAMDCAGCKVHLKVETGMNRIGIKDLDELHEADALLRQKEVLVEGIFTHFACSDEEDNVFCNLQMERFSKAVHYLNKEYKWVHTSNSDATVHYQEDLSNAVRCGLAMYGMTSYQTQLTPVMSLKSKIICVKKVPANEKVGYSAAYTTPEDEWIATIPIGYADGWLRKHQGRMAFIHDQPCEFVGRICMDQCMLRVPEGTQVGDVVELFGEHMPIVQVAKELDTIPYEIMTTLTDRLAKIYYQNNQILKIVNPRFDRHIND